MGVKEAKARIKINKLLEKAGWRFFDDDKGKANIQLELNVKIKKKDLDILGDDFEKVSNGYADYILLDDRGFPLIVLEAKNEKKQPLDAKEQARKYASNLNVRFVILSNGNMHYFWDLESGDPEIITQFPTPDSVSCRKSFKPDKKRLANETVTNEYIAETQMPGLNLDPLYSNPNSRDEFLKINNKLRILRPYQLLAVHTLQKAVDMNKDRFLFEMATGTGKTLLSAALIKLFLRTGNANRVLFLVDRIELEKQAQENFDNYLSNDYTSMVYKHNRDNWRSAEIVVTTIQSFMSQDKYRKLFSPTDFDLVISDEAHRSIGGNSRAVFEYFIGYKIGLTATPKNYLKNIDLASLSEKDPRALEERQLRDTYTTFGCENQEPTFRYSLLDGVKDNYLVNPIVADARTDITTRLLSEKGYLYVNTTEDGEEKEETYFKRHFEKKFFSHKTNLVFCKTFLENALRDPISNEIGKSIIFCVSQKHASKITQMLNKMATQAWTERYNSDFAVQVTSNVQDAQSFTTQFSGNNLNGKSRFLEGYGTSKTRVCVTVGMMTTGYDCTDILNLALMRPVMSPTEFIQMKGRGTRKNVFFFEDEEKVSHTHEKTTFKLFDYFANCEYFEKEYKYDEVLKLPKPGGDGSSGGGGGETYDVKLNTPDKLKKISEQSVGVKGMRIDREFFEKAVEKLKNDKEISDSYSEGNIEKAANIARDKYENKPDLFMTLEKFRISKNLDRRIFWGEILSFAFGDIEKFKTREELIDIEYEKFISIHKPDSKYAIHIRNFLGLYISDQEFRNTIDKRLFSNLNFFSGFNVADLKALDGWKDKIPEYVKNYISLNTFME